MAEDGKKGQGLKTEIIEVDPNEIELLEVNARYMEPEMYKRLVENVRADGCLTSVPLCYRTPEGKLRCVSGNHRTQAACDAGFKKIHAQVITTPISNDEFIAKQLSHNALAGKDNEEILRVLWHKMENPDMKAYSGLDKSMIEKLEIPTVPPIDARLDFEQVTVLFVGKEKSYVQQVAKEVLKRGILSKTTWVETHEAYDQVAETIKGVCDHEGIHNFATAIMIMAEYAQKYMETLDNAGEVTPVTRSTPS